MEQGRSNSHDKRWTRLPQWGKLMKTHHEEDVNNNPKKLFISPVFLIHLARTPSSPSDPSTGLRPLNLIKRSTATSKETGSAGVRYDPAAWRYRSVALFLDRFCRPAL
jgi:hypothetical protein